MEAAEARFFACEDAFLQRRFSTAADMALAFLAAAPDPEHTADPTPSPDANDAAVFEDFEVLLVPDAAPALADKYACILLQSAYETRRPVLAQQFVAHYRGARPMPLPLALLFLRFCAATGKATLAQRFARALRAALRARSQAPNLEAAARQAQVYHGIVSLLVLDLLWGTADDKVGGAKAVAPEHHCFGWAEEEQARLAAAAGPAVVALLTEEFGDGHASLLGAAEKRSLEEQIRHKLEPKAAKPKAEPEPKPRAESRHNPSPKPNPSLNDMEEVALAEVESESAVDWQAVALSVGAAAIAVGALYHNRRRVRHGLSAARRAAGCFLSDAAQML
uniref:Uncharacterized protein n=1 Tax=Phaeomonas parva TaxID=124430 RepID=A0A7S1U820_9STRA|mmetsp:Transcript_32721/g.103595  ORF Transcript_32721/g.103595 Transcript_32721/m.103595 type:complete len:335 (+) Transcript_32721:133-1137(+)